MMRNNDCLGAGAGFVLALLVACTSPSLSVGGDDAQRPPADTAAPLQDARRGADAAPDIEKDAGPRDGEATDADARIDVSPDDASRLDVADTDTDTDADADAAPDSSQRDAGDAVSCPCSEGPCCDGCRFLPAGTVCDSEAQEERGCPWGVRCGADIGRRWRARVCSGTQPHCDGALTPFGSWERFAECDEPDGCVDGACVPVAACADARCPATECPSIEGASGACNLETGHCEYVFTSNAGTWVLVPPGDFDMGHWPSERPPPWGELPRHHVELTRPFLILATELTIGSWRDQMQTDTGAAEAYVFDGYPVRFVSWWDTLAYCNALSAAEGLAPCYRLEECEGGPPGRPDDSWFACAPTALDSLDCDGYRLPTEAEWEYACRAGSDTELPDEGVWSGDPCDAPAIEPYAWFLANSIYPLYDEGEECFPCEEVTPSYSVPCGPRPVAERRPNAWGLYDMLGNVRETVYGIMPYYPDTAVIDPIPDPEAVATIGVHRVTRGASYASSAGFVRCSIRWTGSDLVHVVGGPHGGFRPARTVR